MARYTVAFSSGRSLTEGGMLTATAPLVEGQRVEHYGQWWRVARIDNHQHPPLLMLRRLEHTLSRS